MNPLDALSALSQLQGSPSAGSGAAASTSMLPTGLPAGLIPSSFTLPDGILPPGMTMPTDLSSLTSGLSMPSGVSLPAGTTNAISEGFRNMLQPLPATSAPAPMSSFGGSGGPNTWGHMLHQMVLDVNAKQETAAQKVNDVLQGGPTPVHEAMAATEEATLSFEFLGEMRNKIVESYQQIMTMQV